MKGVYIILAVLVSMVFFLGSCAEEEIKIQNSNTSPRVEVPHPGF